MQALSFPIPTELSGTIVELASGGAILFAPIVYTSAWQVAAILSSNTPVGSGSIKVAYNGMVSGPQPIEIVKNRFNIFTTNQAGTGRGAITDLNYRAFDLQASALPGDIAIIWGTGLGPVAFPDTNPPIPENLQNPTYKS